MKDDTNAPSLSESDLDLLDLVLEDEGIERATSAIPRADRCARLPLSFAQERLWFMDQLEGSTAYNMADAYRLRGQLAVAALEAAFDEVVRRHEVLRSTLPSEEGRPYQEIHPPAPGELPVVDLGRLPALAREAESERVTRAEALRPFDLAAGPLFRYALLRLDGQEHVLLVNTHHIASDGWSVAIIHRELGALYAAFLEERPSPLSELPAQYVDFAVWQRQELRVEEEIAYWWEQLAGTPPLELPTDRPRPPVQVHAGATLKRLLPGEVVRGLRELSRRENASLFMTLLSAFDVLMSRYSGQRDISVGTPIAGREHVDLEDLIGFFLGTLVLRNDLEGDPSFVELLRRVREVCLGAYGHQDLPFEKLLSELQPERDLSRTPFFQVMFNMTNMPRVALELQGLSTAPFLADEVESKYDLTLYLSEEGEEVQLSLVYNTRLFDAPRMEQLLESYAYLLRQIDEAPERPIGRYTLVDPAAPGGLPDPRAVIRAAWEGTVSARVSRWAREDPERTAIAGPAASYSFQQLEETSGRVAAFLHGCGIGPEDVVAIFAARDASLVWTLQGIERAGAAFMVLDPAYPAARLIDLIEVGAPKGFIALEAAGPVPEELSRYIEKASLPCTLVVPLDLEQIPSALGDRGGRPPPTIAVDPQSLQHVAMTSGTTGRPKAIAVPHLGMSQSVRWYTEEFELTGADRFCMISGLTFQPLLREIFSPLWLGGVLCIPPVTDFEEPGQLVNWMAREAITVAQLTPAMSQMLTKQGAPRRAANGPLEAVRYASFTGDLLREGDVARVQQLCPNATCMNFYGVSEKIGPASYEVIPRQGSEPAAGGALSSAAVSSGRGIEGVQLLILNESDGLAGVGELGEICLRSPYLARGYLDEELTRARFVVNPLTGGSEDRIYRTGDLGRYQADGRVTHAGRADDQVQIRGFRVEPGEIAGELARHPGVREVAVLGREDAPGDVRLVAYLVPRSVVAPAVAELRSFLQEKLPAYMVPAAFVMVEALPLTPRGKIDRRALPAPPSSRDDDPEGQFQGPQTPIEELVAEIWCEVLAVEKVGSQDDFFQLGGHSLIATQVIVKIRETFDVDLLIRTLFEASSLAELSLEVERKLVEKYGQEALDELMREFMEHDE